MSVTRLNDHLGDCTYASSFSREVTWEKHSHLHSKDLPGNKGRRIKERNDVFVVMDFLSCPNFSSVLNRLDRPKMSVIFAGGAILSHSLSL